MYSGYVIVLFFFKQKTAYDMRISDWSLDVCSSDLWSANMSMSPKPFSTSARRGSRTACSTRSERMCGRSDDRSSLCRRHGEGDRSLKASGGGAATLRQ